MPWVALAVAAVGIGTSVYGSLQGQAAQKDAQIAQSRLDNLKAARERTQQIREANSKRAMIEQGAANSGAAISSSAVTGAAGVTAEMAQNVQFIGYEQQTGQAISAAKQRELNAEGVSTIGQGMTEAGGVFLNNYKEIKDIFS